MTATLRIDVLGTVKQGVFTPTSPRVATRLPRGSLVIGSRPTTDPCLVLDDGTVSRNHAEVSAGAGCWRIRDLDSDNGLVLLEEELDLASPVAVTALTGRHVEEVAIVSAVTVALGAVLLRLTAEPLLPAGPAAET
jgi:pSer/pThr/pTyr-binding forkhead associated (FHA) protein